MELENIISNSLEEARAELEQFLSDPETVASMTEMTLVLKDALEDGCKILACGNGGSLCDATHFAEELTGRFRGNRRPLPAMAINDPAYMTCTGNDFAFEEIFSRWVEAFGQPGDVLLAISTSGTSRNILLAAEKAREMDMKVVALTALEPLEGSGVEPKANPLAETADVAICAPRAPHSDRIQEIHIKVIHIVIEALERALGL